MNESILTSVKKTLGMDEAYTAFDPDIVLFINGVLADLHALGVGPAEGFQITGKDEEWVQFLSNDMTLNNVKTYMSLRAKLLFDPPESGYGLAAFKEQIAKWEWYISEHREEMLPEVIV